MTIDVIASIAPVIIGVIFGFGLTRGYDFLIQRDLRKKYSTIFFFELQQLKNELDSAISRYNNSSQSEVPNLNEEERREYGIEYAIDFLPYYYFKSKYTFLEKNFEKISIFEEGTIKSIIKINSLMEEYDAISKGSEKVFLIQNLRIIQKEIQITLDLLKKEGK
jgi:hypothetical protein